MNLVMDCSYAMALIMPDEERPDSSEHALTHDLIAPALWSVEVASAVQNGIRRRRLTPEEGRDVCELAHALGVELQTQENYTPADHLQLALTYDLTPYDAVYLDLALKLHAPLATRDNKMIAVARKVGLTVFE
jgi:predicted nucleic acid-binding protein